MFSREVFDFVPGAANPVQMIKTRMALSVINTSGSGCGATGQEGFLSVWSRSE
jgi:hypothetical protein